KVTISDVVYAPDAINNLISLSRLADAGCKVVFEGDLVSVLSPKLRTCVATGTKPGRLYHMDISAVSPSGTEPELAMVAKNSRTWDEWH
ncbi:hypothetical protein B0H17DRAFT_896378, partial [Mycena rosella]